MDSTETLSRNRLNREIDVPVREPVRRAGQTRTGFLTGSPARVLAIAAAALGAVALLAAFGPALWDFFSNGEALQQWIRGQGPLAPVTMAALVGAQVVVAVLPGEPLELAAGYLFGFWGGTALCLIGELAGTIAVTLLAKRFGYRVALVFFSREKLEFVAWLRDSKRLEAIMFVVFLIPGTPKDVLTYVAGLTDCPVGRIALITTVGRIPSVATSTLAAGFAAQGEWLLAAAAMGVALALVAVGAGAYALVRRRAARN